ncbi:Protein GrpE [Nitrosotalea sinensis]|jgi:molecular chaperone GrpE|uniref:Protein GrpE n=1 Tax=Nitrosotalea sinensis TaxID=1499975 RepID=A0A2H1EFV2_9ARCH|nr:nucleotide exchange factor GrpE [Candidatus Nitrosotalea sinensis]SHO44236.1 Protein GrpE [Candidatus Nitrosotalea sinensis]
MSDISENNLEEFSQEKNGDMQSEQELANLKNQLEQEQEKVLLQEKKIQYLLADFENIKKRSEIDVQNRVNSITDGMILKFLGIYDDFARARDALSKQHVNSQGLDAILKNMNSFLSEFGVKPIEATGEIFDPKLHEAISIKEDPTLHDNTIIAELRKGYILKERVIRPSLVEISKRNVKETNVNG